MRRGPFGIFAEFPLFLNLLAARFFYAALGGMECNVRASLKLLRLFGRMIQVREFLATDRDKIALEFGAWSLNR